LNRLLIILNGTPVKTARFHRQWKEALARRFQLTIAETHYAGHATTLTQSLLETETPDAILAAGGDGTLNQVLNGQMLSGRTDIPLGIIPLGTGNDFAGFTGINSPAALIDAILAGARTTDVGSVTGAGADGQVVTRYFINVSSMGMGPDVVRRLENDSRSLGPTLTYLRATIRSFFGYQPELVRVITEEQIWSGRIRALAVANGRSFGSGLVVAPKAEADNGVLSTFIAGDVPLHEFLWFLGRIKLGHFIRHTKAAYGTCTALRVETPEGEVWTETDGELAVKLPVEYRVIPGAIRFFRR